MNACTNGHLNVVKLLLERKAHVDLTSNVRATRASLPLSVCVRALTKSGSTVE